MALLNKIKSKNIYKDFDLDFIKHPVSKDLVKVIDDNSIKQSVELLLGMDYFESPMQPQKGSPVSRLLFEPMGIDIVIELKEAVEEVLGIYEPRVTVIDVQVKPDYINASYEVKIIFKILNNIDLSVISFILSKVN